MRKQPIGDHRGYRSTAMPGVYERGSVERPYWSVKYTDGDGRRPTERFSSFDEACGFKARMSNEAERHTHRRPEPTTFCEYADQWPDRYRGRTTTGLRDATRERYRKQIAVAMDFLGGHSGRRPLGSVMPEHIEAFVDHLYESGHNPVTVRRYMVPLRAMLSQAVRERRIKTNPASDVPLLPSDMSLLPDTTDEQEKMKALSSEQTAALIAAVPASQRLLVTVIACTGLRISEALGLRWRDIDRQAGEVRVRQAAVGGKIGKPKTKRSQRSVPLSDEVMRDLVARRLASRDSGDDDLVFGTRSGQPVESSSCYRWLRPAAESIGAPWAGFHALRHGAASAWFKAGYKVTVVSALLGHSTASFTLSVYVHMLPEDMPDGDALRAAVGI